MADGPYREMSDHERRFYDLGRASVIDLLVDETARLESGAADLGARDGIEDECALAPSDGSDGESPP